MNVKEQIKSTGATFTPGGLADFLALEITKYIDTNQSLSVLDPSCGEGELLLSIKKVLDDKNLEYSLSGFDTNQSYLEEANSRFELLDSNKVRLKQGDFLELVDLSDNQLSLGFGDNKEDSKVNCSADVIIANPPYVRTQVLGSKKAQELAKKFNLKGRVDLYYPFLISMTESLKEGGILGVITSNRYLSTKGGESIRKYLVENYEILEVIDLGDTKLFDAAVLPAIFIGRKRSSKNGNSIKKEAQFIKLYEELNGYNGELTAVGSIYDILKNSDSGYFNVGEKRYKRTNGLLKYESNSGSPWQMLSETEANWTNLVQKNAKGFVGDFFKVRVGIKTTADKVFISDNWERLGSSMPERQLLKELISQENIERWGVNDKVRLKVLYTHELEEGKKKTINIDNYPLAKEYFLSHSEQLKGRKYVISAGREWFEIWVPQNPKYWKMPKLVFPDISVNPRFYFDNGGKIVNGNCYWIVAQNPKEEELLLLIQGVANTKLMTKYHDLVFNNKLYSGRRRYFSQFVEQYPIPDSDRPESKQIISLVKTLNGTMEKEKQQSLEIELEKLVASAFGVETVLNLD
ncbi:MAG: N-6 DNA methylase [Bacteroidota bacterium]|nr:N-6 DNA methylase [Bacteroidota bacterium]